MGYSEENKRLAKNTVFLFLRSIFLLGISLYTSRVTLQILGEADFGVYSVVGGVVAMFSMFSQTLSSASQRFITYSLGGDDGEEVKKVFSNCVTLHFLLGIIIVIILELSGIWFLDNKLNVPAERLESARWVFHISVVTFFVGVVSVPYNAVIIAHEKMSAFALISVIEGVVKLCAVFVLLVVTWDKLILYALLMFAISMVKRFVFSAYSRRHFSEARNVSFSLETGLFKEMFAFSGWNLIGNGSLVLRNQGVDIVINLFYGVTVNAGKAICNQIQNTVEVFVGNFTTALRPQLTKAMAGKRRSRVNDLINNGTRYSFCLMLFVTTPIFILAHDLLDVWLVNVPIYAVAFVKLAMVYLLMRPLTVLLIHSILSFGNIRNYQLTVGIIKLFAVPIVYVLYSIGCSPIAAMYTNIFIEIVCLITTLVYMWKLFGFNSCLFVTHCLYRCAITSSVAMCISYGLMMFIDSNVFVKLPVVIIVTTVSIWFLALNEAEHKKVLAIALNKLHHYNIRHD